MLKVAASNFPKSSALPDVMGLSRIFRQFELRLKRSGDCGEPVSASGYVCSDLFFNVTFEYLCEVTA